MRAKGANLAENKEWRGDNGTRQTCVRVQFDSTTDLPEARKTKEMPFSS